MIDFVTSEELVKYFALGWWYHSTGPVGELGGGALIRKCTLCLDVVNQKEKKSVWPSCSLDIQAYYKNTEQKHCLTFMYGLFYHAIKIIAYMFMSWNGSDLSVANDKRFGRQLCRSTWPSLKKLFKKMDELRKIIKCSS